MGHRFGQCCERGCRKAVLIKVSLTWCSRLLCEDILSYTVWNSGRLTVERSRERAAPQTDKRQQSGRRVGVVNVRKPSLSDRLGHRDAMIRGGPSLSSNRFIRRMSALIWLGRVVEVLCCGFAGRPQLMKEGVDQRSLDRFVPCVDRLPAPPETGTLSPAPILVIDCEGRQTRRGGAPGLFAAIVEVDRRRKRGRLRGRAREGGC